MVDVISLIKLRAKTSKQIQTKKKREAGPLILISGDVENK